MPLGNGYATAACSPVVLRVRPTGRKKRSAGLRTLVEFVINRSVSHRSTMPADSADTRRAILDAAEAQFSELGFAGASMSVIAEGARVSKALLHHHFGSKEGLWHAVKERRFGEFWPEQSQLAAGKLDGAWFADSLEAYFAYLQ